MSFFSTSALIGLVKNKLIELVENNEATIDKVFRENLGKLSPEDKVKFLSSWHKLDTAVRETIPDSPTAPIQATPISAETSAGGKRTRRKARKQRKHHK